MIIKGLSQSGNSKAILLERTILQAAGLTDDALFAITINPNGGIVIKSIEPPGSEIKKKAFKQVLKKHGKLLKRLAGQ